MTEVNVFASGSLSVTNASAYFGTDPNDKNALSEAIGNDIRNIFENPTVEIQYGGQLITVRETTEYEQLAQSQGIDPTLPVDEDPNPSFYAASEIILEKLASQYGSFWTGIYVKIEDPGYLPPAPTGHIWYHSRKSAVDINALADYFGLDAEADDFGAELEASLSDMIEQIQRGEWNTETDEWELANIFGLDNTSTDDDLIGIMQQYKQENLTGGSTMARKSTAIEFTGSGTIDPERLMEISDQYATGSDSQTADELVGQIMGMVECLDGLDITISGNSYTMSGTAYLDKVIEFFGEDPEDYDVRDLEDDLASAFIGAVDEEEEAITVTTLDINEAGMGQMSRKSNDVNSVVQEYIDQEPDLLEKFQSTPGFYDIPLDPADQEFNVANDGSNPTGPQPEFTVESNGHTVTGRIVNGNIRVLSVKSIAAKFYKPTLDEAYEWYSVDNPSALLNILNNELADLTSNVGTVNTALSNLQLYDASNVTDLISAMEALRDTANSYGPDASMSDSVPEWRSNKGKKKMSKNRKAMILTGTAPSSQDFMSYFGTSDPDSLRTAVQDTINRLMNDPDPDLIADMQQLYGSQDPRGADYAYNLSQQLEEIPFDMGQMSNRKSIFDPEALASQYGIDTMQSGWQSELNDHIEDIINGIQASPNWVGGEDYEADFGFDPDIDRMDAIAELRKIQSQLLNGERSRKNVGKKKLTLSKGKVNSHKSAYDLEAIASQYGIDSTQDGWREQLANLLSDMINGIRITPDWVGGVDYQDDFGFDPNISSEDAINELSKMVDELMSQKARPTKDSGLIHSFVEWFNFTGTSTWSELKQALEDLANKFASKDESLFDGGYDSEFFKVAEFLNMDPLNVYAEDIANTIRSEELRLDLGANASIYN